MLLSVLFYAATLSTVLLARLAAGSWRWGYLLGGLAFGLYNEIFFEFCWDYSPKLGPMVWRDVPLLVILGWGTIGMLSLSISDRIQGRLPAVKLHPGLVLLGLDVAIYCAFGLLEELTMSRLGYWKYNFPIQGLLPVQIGGYIGVALQVSSLGRRIESIRVSG